MGTEKEGHRKNGFHSHTNEKNLDVMNTSFWVSVGETGQQKEKIKTVNLCQIKKTDNR
jgi:hypothetical protein